MQHTTTRALIPTHAFRRSLYLLTTVLIASPVSGAFAQSLVPDMPSVELHLDALESLRPAAPNFPPPAPPTGMFSSAPASAPVAQPFTRTQAPAPTPRVAERHVPVDNPQPVQQPVVQTAPVQKTAQPARTILPAPPPPLSAPIAKKPVVVAAPKPQPKPAAVAVKPSTAPAKAPVAPVRVPTEVVKPVEAPVALPTLSDVKPAPAIPAVDVAKPAPAPLEAAAQKPAPLLDFSKLGAPKPAVQPVAPVATPSAPREDVDDVLKSLDAANQKAAPVKSSDAFPTLSPLPDLKPVDAALPAPQGASATANEVMVAAPVVKPTQPAALPAAAPDDEKLKNLADRMNNLFVKDAQKQGIVSDKTVVTGPQQSLPKQPPAEAPAPVSNASQPKPGSVLDKLAKGAENAPVIPSAAPVAKPVVSAPVVADAKPALPELPALPSLPASKVTPEKPKQLTLEEVNKKSPPETMSASPRPVVVPEASKPAAIEPVKAPVIAAPVATKPAAIEPVALKPLTPAPVIAAKPEAAPVAAAAKKPVEPIQLSAAAPSKAPADALKPGAVAALPAMPAAAQATSSSSIASADSLASILPPPSKDAKPALKAMDVTKEPVPAGLPKLPSLADAPALPSSLPPLSALTGEKKSSMDIALDKDGVRSSTLEPLAPATAANTIPSMAKTDSDALPKVTHGEVAPAAKKEPVKPVASAAVATPEKPEPVQLASTSVPATPGSATPATVARAVALPADAGKPILSVTFDKDKTDVELDMQTKIAGIADAAKKGSSVRVLAYATGTPEEKSAARRISLSRALQVRAKLIDKGVDPMKITVQALGNAGSAPRDAADIIVK